MKRNAADNRWVKRYRLEHECGLYEACEAWNKRELRRMIDDAKNLDDIKEILREIVGW